jgi:hypothetical protein
MSIKLCLVALAAIGVASVAQAQDVVIEGDVPVVEQAPADDAVLPAHACMDGRCGQQTAERSAIGMACDAQMRAMNRPLENSRP